MLDWQKRVRELQTAHECKPQLETEQVAEIPGHLEEVYLNELRCGMEPAKAEKRALSEVQDWRGMCKKVFLARREESMAEMIKKLWLPSLVMLVLAVAAISGAFQNGVFPHGFSLNSQVALFLYAPWILGSFTLGFLGALWVRRIGAGRGATAALFFLPACALVVLFLVRPPVTWSLIPLYPGRLVGYLAECLTMWGLIPVLATLAGVMIASKMSNHSRALN